MAVAVRSAKKTEKAIVKRVGAKPAAPKTTVKTPKPVSRPPAETVAAVKPGPRQPEAKAPPRVEAAGKAEGSGAPASAAKAAKATPAVAASVAPVAVTSTATRASPEASKDKEQKAISVESAQIAAKAGKPTGQRQGFKINEFVVYPAHGVGQIIAIEEQEVAGFKLELFVISFSKDKMTLRVPTSKVTAVGMRKISDPEAARRSMEILTGRARVKRTMWSRRAQEYETKINSGDINAIAEVVRDLYRSDAQPEQSYSERQLYEAALDRMVREIAAVQKSNEIDALRAVEAQLQKNQGRLKALAASSEAGEARDPEIEEAA
ncbi:MAG TPA: CarD family transcriptional regulator [Pirellulales bacterium]|nr:CarD family transcriptional regulator [Pirellulales bacterium]